MAFLAASSAGATCSWTMIERCLPLTIFASMGFYSPFRSVRTIGSASPTNHFCRVLPQIVRLYSQFGGYRLSMFLIDSIIGSSYHQNRINRNRLIQWVASSKNMLDDDYRNGLFYYCSACGTPPLRPACFSITAIPIEFRLRMELRGKTEPYLMETRQWPVRETL